MIILFYVNETRNILAFMVNMPAVQCWKKEYGKSKMEHQSMLQNLIFFPKNWEYGGSNVIY